MTPEQAFVLADKVAVGEFESVEKDLNVLPDQESSYRIRFFFYRLMSFKSHQDGKLELEKSYLAKAESYRKKWP